MTPSQMPVLLQSAIPSRIVRFVTGAETPRFVLVSKLTFELRPGTSPLSSEHEAIAPTDIYYPNDRHRIWRVRDAVPPKSKSDVLVVGSAFAPAQSRGGSFDARLRFATIDKTLRVQPTRYRDTNGTVVNETGSHATPLRYELTYGGPDTWNPRGLDGKTADADGRTPLPRIEAAQADEAHEPIGLSPLPFFAERLARVTASQSDDDVTFHWGIEPTVFNAAPVDQQLDGPIPDPVQIELVNLDPVEARFSTTLERAYPIAHIAGHPPVVLHPDTLLIDTDAGVCLVTYRAALTDVAPGATVRIGLERGGRPASLGRGRTAPLERQMTQEFDASALVRGAVDTPFSIPPGAPAETPIAESTQEMPRPALDTPVPQTVRRPVVIQAMEEPPRRVELAAPAQPSPPPLHVETPTFEKPRPIVREEQAPPARVPVSRGAGPSPASALAASNEALAAPEAGASSKNNANRRERIPRTLASPQAAPEAIEMVWFADDVVMRLRSASLLARAFPENIERERPTEVGSDEAPPDVRRALLFAEPKRAPDKEIEMTPGDRKNGVFRPPLMLVRGDLVASFDPRSTLEALLGTIAILLPNDKPLRALADGSRALLEHEWVTPAAFDQAAQNLHDALVRHKDAVAQRVEPTVERLLLEKRAYRTRPVFGGEHLRFTWFDEGRPGLPIYVPALLKYDLPLYVRFPARAIVEVRPRNDAYETHGVALRLRALARRLEAEPAPRG